jgi:diaminopropionate ammonia-lyase
VQAARLAASRSGWHVIADTAYAGYLTIPKYIMAGYLTIFREIEQQILDRDDPPIDQIFVQAGVGSLAATAAWYYTNRNEGDRLKLISVEPEDAACLLASAVRGEITTVAGTKHSLMAGLDCPTPSLLAWPLVRDSFDLFLAISDDYALDAMRSYYHPSGGDPQVISGESGAAGLAGLVALLTSRELNGAREYLGIMPESQVLLINTEGATDPNHFAKVVRGQG